MQLIDPEILGSTFVPLWSDESATLIGAGTVPSYHGFGTTVAVSTTASSLLNFAILRIEDSALPRHVLSPAVLSVSFGCAIMVSSARGVWLALPCRISYSICSLTTPCRVFSPPQVRRLGWPISDAAVHSTLIKPVYKAIGMAGYKKAVKPVSSSPFSPQFSSSKNKVFRQTNTETKKKKFSKPYAQNFASNHAILHHPRYPLPRQRCSGLSQWTLRPRIQMWRQLRRCSEMLYRWHQQCGTYGHVIHSQSLVGFCWSTLTSLRHCTCSIPIILYALRL